MTPSSKSGTGKEANHDRPRVDPRIRQRRAAIARRQGRRRLRVVAALLVVIVLAVVAFGVLHTTFFSAQKVEVTGQHPHTSTAAILSAAGLTGHPPLIDVNPGASAAKVERLPWIATARVIRRWPDHLGIAVTERVASATMAGPGNSWSEVDRTGRTVQVDPTRPPGLAVLVVHDAAGPVPPAPLGEMISPAALPGLRVAGTLPPAFSAQVVSVTGDPDGTVDLALNSGITVLLGTDTDLHAKYEDVAAIIAHASLRGAKTIDVTVAQSPTVSSS